MQKKHWTKCNTLIKLLIKLGIEGNFPNLIKGICEIPTADIILNGERLNASPLRRGTRQEYLLSSLLFNTTLEGTVDV